MGRQDRDWAKLGDDELVRLYGAVPRRTRNVRVRIWSGVALLTLATGGFAYTQRTTTAPVVVAAPPPAVLIGLRGTNRRLPSESPGGTGTVCSEEEFAAESQQWLCLVWEINIRHLPVMQPPPYVGACTHLLAAQNQIRWTCLGAAPPPPDPLPAPVPGHYA